MPCLPMATRLGVACLCLALAQGALAVDVPACRDANNTDPFCVSLRTRCKQDMKSDPNCQLLEPQPPAALPGPTPTPLALFSDDVRRAIDDCIATMKCGPSLKTFETAKPEHYQWIRNWCSARGLERRAARTEIEKEVCDAIGSNQAEQVSIYALADLLQEVNPASCSAFGLTIPLFAIRYSGNGNSVVGPIEAGLGGGYYHALTCKRNFSFGAEFFGWSQGLDPSGTFQVGMAAGVQIVAYKYFQFGLAVGYDLYRKGPNIPTNGLLSGKNLGLPSLSTLLTFTISGSDTQAGPGKSP